jgi:hypothetical protein
VLSEAGTYTNEVAIDGGDTSRATLKIPADAAGKAFQVICEVTDTGTPKLSGYRRIIVQPTAK